MASVQKRQALGKGLGALIPQKTKTISSTSVVSEEVAEKGVLTVSIEDVRPNKQQPRRTFDDGPLNELAASIEEHGLMQPILVRRKGEAFEIIAGERRWRASQRAGLKEIQVIVKDLADTNVFEWALIENIQREDLNPIEEAEAYKRLIEHSGLTQEQLAGRVSKDRSTIANSLRLLKLPTDVRRQVIAGAISMGHARALLSLDTEAEMVKMAREVVKRGLSVRDVERQVRALRRRGSASDEKVDPFSALPGGAPAANRAAEELMKLYGTHVRVVPQGLKGRIEIDYGSYEELNRVLGLLKR